MEHDGLHRILWVSGIVFGLSFMGLCVSWMIVRPSRLATWPKYWVRTLSNPIIIFLISSIISAIIWVMVKARIY